MYAQKTSGAGTSLALIVDAAKEKRERRPTTW